MPETPTGAADARPAQLMEALVKAFLIFGSLTVSVLSGCRGDDGSDDPASKSSESGPDLDVFLSERFSGEGTYYDFADGSGACSFDPSPDDMNIAALNQPQWDGSSWCGACAEVTGPSGSVRIRIVDLCPECPHGNLDFSPQAFDQVAERELGRVPIDWHFVPCDVSGPIAYRFKDGANEWWTALQVWNHRLPIATLEWSMDGETWNPTVRQDYNYFLDESGFGPDPVRVRVTAVDGQVLEDALPAVQEELVVEGHAQFE